MRKKHVVNKLLDLAFISESSKYKPGKIVERLTAEERVICKTLVAKDFNHRVK